MTVETKPGLREENGPQGADGIEEAIAKAPPMKRGLKFWTIIFALCITGLLGALENTVVSTSMPTIVEDLGLGDNYIWITDAFFLARYLYPLPPVRGEPSLKLTLSGNSLVQRSSPYLAS